MILGVETGILVKYVFICIITSAVQSSDSIRKDPELLEFGSNEHS